MSNISQIQVNNTTYDIKDAVARDEKINKSEIAEPYDSTKTYSNGDIFEYNGELWQVLNDTLPTPIDWKLVEPITLCDIYIRNWVGSSIDLPTSYIPTKTFAFTNDDNEIIWINSISISKPHLQPDNKYYMRVEGTKKKSEGGFLQYGVIFAKNDLTGIDNIDDAERLLKIQKVNDEYVVTYTNSSMTKKTNTDRHLKYNLSISKGTSPIGYVRGYAVFINDDNTETIMYTPCKLLSWEETQS